MESAAYDTLKVVLKESIQKFQAMKSLDAKHKRLLETLREIAASFGQIRILSDSETSRFKELHEEIKKYTLPNDSGLLAPVKNWWNSSNEVTKLDEYQEELASFRQSFRQLAQQTKENDQKSGRRDLMQMKPWAAELFDGSMFVHNERACRTDDFQDKVLMLLKSDVAYGSAELDQLKAVIRSVAGDSSNRITIIEFASFIGTHETLDAALEAQKRKHGRQSAENERPPKRLKPSNEEPHVVRIRNVKNGEFLYTGSNFLDPKRRHALTWCGEANDDHAMLWEVASCQEPHVVRIRNVKTGEFLYTGSKKLDSDRRHALTWCGEANDDHAMLWEVASCQEFMPFAFSL